MVKADEAAGPGEVLSITTSAVDQCLGPGADRLLFETLVEAALASEVGVASVLSL